MEVAERLKVLMSLSCGCPVWTLDARAMIPARRAEDRGAAPISPLAKSR